MIDKYAHDFFVWFAALELRFVGIGMHVAAALILIAFRHSTSGTVSYFAALVGISVNTFTVSIICILFLCVLALLLIRNVAGLVIGLVTPTTGYILMAIPYIIEFGNGLPLLLGLIIYILTLKVISLENGYKPS